MTESNRKAHQTSNETLAIENCCAQQVVLSMFEHVSAQDLERLVNRSDQEELAKFSNALLENEFIFGSPSESVLRSIEKKMSAKREKKSIS